MDDQGCPRCKTTKYRNPSLKLMVNVCGHTLCENCVDMLFVRGSGNCVQCDTPLRKSNFRLQLFEDPAVDKEVEIRKKVLKMPTTKSHREQYHVWRVMHSHVDITTEIHTRDPKLSMQDTALCESVSGRCYNKRDIDFPSLREYNDYLEQVEEIVYNLTNNVDIESTRQMMEQYQRENRDIIQKNKAKLTREQEELEELLLLEQQDMEQKRLVNLQEEQRSLHTKRKNKQALLDELERSQLPASLLLAEHKRKASQLETQIEKQKQNVKPGTIFSTGILAGQTVSLAPVIREPEKAYEYQPLQIQTHGPVVPELEQLGRLGYLNHVRSATQQDLAGGYSSGLACHRAIQDAFSGLFIS